MSDDHVPNESEAYAIAVGLLARREHTARELLAKLQSRSVAPVVAGVVLERLQAERLQSDERYVEVYLRQRSAKGYGPQRIVAELRERGVDEGLITAQLRRAEAAGEVDWFELAAAAYAKKFGGSAISNMNERAKRLRFMLYRGFTHEQIAAAIECN